MTENPESTDLGMTIENECVQIGDEQQFHLQSMVQKSVKAHGLLKQGKGIKKTAIVCDLPIHLVEDMANEINHSTVNIIKIKQSTQRKAKRKAQTKARKANR